jgi:hypothetical protein
MFIAVGLVLLTLVGVLPALAHDPFVLDARRAAPNGVRLELTELPSAVPESRVKYRLTANGLPQGVTFGLFSKDFSHSFHEVATGFKVDETGSFVSTEIRNGGRYLRFDDIVLEPGPYPKGAAWEVALVSADRAIRAFAKVIPYPITSRDRTCSVSLELVSQRGDRFIATGSGFAPEEDIITESQYSGRIIQKQKRVSPEGVLPGDVISLGARGSDRSARYIVKGQSCEVILEYQWGEPAIIRH